MSVTAEGLDTDPLTRLSSGPLFWFADWPCGDVPRSGALVYTIWDRAGRFIYAGMAGRGLAPEATAARTGSGPWGRLNSHASGRRSGDQFCVYVCDRLVLPTVVELIPEIATGRRSLDQLTRAYIREHLGFRWTAFGSGTEALAVEIGIQRGSLGCGRPLLNPLGVPVP